MKQTGLLGEFKLLRTIHQMPPWFIKRWQVKSVKRLLAFAQHITFYKRIWKNINLTNIQEVEDLINLPETNKQLFKKYPPKEYVELSRGKLSRWAKTSGTTGEPLEFPDLYSSLSRSQINFFMRRFLLWRGASLPEVVHTTRIVRTCLETPIPQYPNRFPVQVRDLLGKKKEVLNSILNFRGTIIESYPSLLFFLSKFILESGLFEKLRFKYALSFGERLLSSQRKFIGEVLQCEVYDSYGMMEFGTIGVECRYHIGFHLHSESFILEVVDSMGFPVPAEGRGRIVITDLRNYTMPLIRYVTGDYGRKLREECRCGLGSERFVVEGREGKLLLFGNTKIHSYELEVIFEDFSKYIMQYQVLRKTANFIKISIQPADVFSVLVLNKLESKIKSRIGRGVHIEFEVVECVPRLPSGKAAPVIDEYFCPISS